MKNKKNKMMFAGALAVLVIGIGSVAAGLILELFSSGGLQNPQAKDVLRAADVNPTAAEHMKQSGRVDNHVIVDSSLKPLSLCGKEYVARRVVIDGIDVIQGIANLTSSGVAAERSIQSGQEPRGASTIACWNINHNTPDAKVYGQSKSVEVPVFDVVSEPWDKDGAATAYYIGVDGVRFVVNSSTYDVYTQNAYDSTLSLIGNLKK